MPNLKIYELNSGLPTGPTDVLPVTQISSGDAQKVQLKDVVFYSNSGSSNTLLGLNSGATQNEYKSLSSGIGVGVYSVGADFAFNFNNASGLITSGTLGDSSVNSGNIASGVISSFDISSGAIISGLVGNSAVNSGNIASGQIGINHLQSGLIGASSVIPTTSGLNFVPMVRNLSGNQQAFVASGLMYSVESGTLQVNQSFLNNLNGEVQNQNFGYQNAPNLRSGAFQAAVQTFGFQCFLGANGFNQSQGFGSLLFPTLSSGTNIQAFGYNLGLQATNLRDSSVIGANSLAQLLSGQDLVIVGTDSANNASGGANLQTLRHAVLIGNNITTATTDENNVVVIAQSGRSMGSNTTVIGNSATTSGAIFGNINFPAGMNVGSGSARITASGWFEGLVGSGAVGSGSLASGYIYSQQFASGGTSLLATENNNRFSGSRNTVIFGDANVSSGNGFLNNTVIIGSNSARSFTSGSNENVIIGSSNFLTASGRVYGSTAVGSQAMANAGLLASFNVAIGHQALQFCGSSGNIGIGYKAGAGAGSAYAGTNNVAIGYQALDVIAAGSDNISIGVNALGATTTGNRNVAVGRDALAFGVSSNDNVGLGYRAGAYEAINSGQMTARSNVCCLGNGAAINSDNSNQIGNQLTTTYVFGTVQNRSDIRDKTDVREISHGLDFIEKVQPKEFRWNYRESYWDYTLNADGTEDRTFNQQEYELAARKRNRFHAGVIAQELKTTLNEMNFDFAGLQDHTLVSGGPVMSVGYDAFIPYLIKAVQELSAEIKALKEKQNGE